MSPRATLAYGSRPLEIELPAGSAVVEPPPAPAAPPLEILLERALDAPVQARRLEQAVKPSDRVLIIASDASRDDPRGAMLEAVRRRLPPSISIAVAVANGTHFPAGVQSLGLPSWVDRVIDHDARDPSRLVEIGRSRRGTPFRVNRALLETDWIIATGSIRPHYFAGFGAGVKAIFPGLGENEAVRINHRLKLDRTARPGVFEGNACRDDLEEIVGFLEARCFLLNTVETPQRTHVAAIAGDVVGAFREGARLCAPLWQVSVSRARSVLVSDSSPIADSLYQASKMVAMVAPALAPGAVVTVAAECASGLGGAVDVVNKAIYELGVLPRLPTGAEVRLVSQLGPEVVAPTHYRWYPSVADAIGEIGGPTLVIPRAAGSLLYRIE